MRTPFRVAVAASLAFSLTLIGPPQQTTAFCHDFSTKWSSPTQTLTVWYTVPSGWNSAISASRSAWNGIDTLNYLSPIFGAHYTSNFNLSRADFSNVGWDDVPGLTINNSNSQPHSSSNVYLNTDFSWNLTGVMDQPNRNADVRTVLTHELGHSSGLDHPSWCGQMSQNEIDSAMNPNWKKKWATNVDDHWGIEDIYP